MAQDLIGQAMSRLFRWLKENTRESLTVRAVSGGNTPNRIYTIRGDGGELCEFRLYKNGRGIRCEIIGTVHWSRLPDANRVQQAKENFSRWLDEQNKEGWG